MGVWLWWLDRVGFVTYLGLGVVSAILLLRAGIDSDLYWRTGQSAHYYGETWAADSASRYVYPPPLAQAVGALGFLTWPVFNVAWVTVMFVAFWASTRWWSLPVLAVFGTSALLFGLGRGDAPNPFVYPLIGNPQTLLAACIVAGFRYPALWSVVILTKIAPGIGVLWFAVRGEWRNLAIALGATAVIAAVSFALAPGTWFDFLRFATTNAGAPSPEPVVPIPFVVRSVMSVALLVWGARTDRKWTVPVATAWASLALYEWSYVAIWLAALPLLTWPGRPTWRPGRRGSGSGEPLRPSR